MSGPMNFLKKKGEPGRIVICCGSGGVGKTSISAAIGLQAAVVGYKTLVLTIDPAKRLADALGINRVGNAARKVPAERLAKLGLSPAGELYAMVLDTKRTFDQLIIKYSSSERMRETILKNRYYQHISSALAGTHEYMAMEKVHDIYEKGEYELIVLDTPPNRRSIDFLEAPDRLINLLSGRAFQFLLKPSFLIGRWGFRMFTKFSSPILDTFSRVLGIEMLKDVSDFFRLADDAMYEGFRTRADRVRELLRDERTLFLVIATPTPSALAEAVFFYNKLREYKMNFGGFVINRVHMSYLDSRAHRSAFNRFVKNSDLANARLMKKLLENFHSFEMLAEIDERNIEEALIEQTGRAGPLKRIPYFETDVHDFAKLRKMAELLFDWDNSLVASR